MEIRKIDEGLQKLVNQAWEVRKRNFPPVIQFDIPKDTEVVSLTGSSCSLDCAHCGGHYLKHMTPAEHALDSVRSKNRTSCLISGGCNEKGALDIVSNAGIINGLKDSGCKLNMHVGLIDDDQIDKVAGVADCVSFDFLVDSETVREVYGTDKTGKDYIDVYRKLRRKVRVLPHICIGLLGGEVKGEYEAIGKLKELGADALVFIVFIPTPGTRYANRKPAKLSEVIQILAKARIDFPDIPIHLGCMRPKGMIRAEIDYYAIGCGVNKLVNPTRVAVQRAQELGLETRYGGECCVL